MRAAVGIVFLISVLPLIGPGYARADSEAAENAPSRSVFYGPKHAHKVSIETAGGAIAVVEFPEGVLLGLTVPVHGNPPMQEALVLPSSFQGDIVVRARREDELTPDESTSAREIMAQAPLVMELTEVILVVEETANP